MSFIRLHCGREYRKIMHFQLCFHNSEDHPHTHTIQYATDQEIPHLESCEISKCFLIRQPKAVLSVPPEMQGRFELVVISGQTCEWCCGRSTVFIRIL